MLNISVPHTLRPHDVKYKVFLGGETYMRDVASAHNPSLSKRGVLRPGMAGLDTQGSERDISHYT